ncbi:MAG: NAD-dependent deacetylase [Actinobacteria bacterium]|nr:NAD-dependent deacetylase [Actinomycetota bacterium]MBM3712183.1 NAD-dependent deacetylase [Actinomycetota bacterium]
MLTGKAKLIARHLRSSKKTVVLTGAGISTESGIPDFRSPGSGIWTKFDPYLMTGEALYTDPKNFYENGLKFLEFLYSIKNAEPNKAHLALAELERLELVSAVITQNIDGLHRKAGSKNIFEIHGNLEEAYCMRCKSKTTFDELVKKLSGGQIPPLCDLCSQRGRKGILRPNLVLFGDILPSSFKSATREVKTSSLLIVVGSSLEVYPANRLPANCRSFIIINREETGYDSHAEIAWHENAGKALEQILKELLKVQ